MCDLIVRTPVRGTAVDILCFLFSLTYCNCFGFDIFPVCLTLSSDDEESAQSDLDSAVTGERSLNNGQRLSTDDIPYTSPDPEVTSSARGKEPIIPEEDDTGSDTGENQHTQGVRGWCVQKVPLGNRRLCPYFFCSHLPKFDKY